MPSVHPSGRLSGLLLIAVVVIVAGGCGDRAAAVPAEGVTRIFVPTPLPPGTTPAPTARPPRTPEPAPAGWEKRFCVVKRLVTGLQDTYNTLGPIHSRADLARWRRVTTRLIADAHVASARIKALPDWPVARPLLAVYARLASRTAADAYAIRQAITHLGHWEDYRGAVRRAENAWAKAIWDKAFADADYGPRLHVSCSTS